MLGHACGGIQEQAFTTGLDAVTGVPVGDVYLQTRCSTGGIGGHTVTYAGTTVSQSAPASTLTATFAVSDVPDWSVHVRAHNAAGWGPWPASVLLGGV